MQAKSYKVVTILHFSKKVEGIRNFGVPASPRNPKKGRKKRAPGGSLQWRWGWGIIRAESQQKAIRGGQKAMTRFDDYLAEQLQDPEFRAEWEALQPERAIVQAMIDARQKTGLTQKQLAEKTGISQSDISKFETGSGNP